MYFPNQMKLYPNVNDFGFQGWSGQSSIAKWEIGESFHLPRWFLNSPIMIAFLYFHISDNPLKTMYQEEKKGKEKSLRQLLRVKNFDLLIFLLWVSLISYPNDTKGLLQVSCALSDSTLKWNLTLFFFVRVFVMPCKPNSDLMKF